MVQAACYMHASWQANHMSRCKLCRYASSCVAFCKDDGRLQRQRKGVAAAAVLARWGSSCLNAHALYQLQLSSFANGTR